MKIEVKLTSFIPKGSLLSPERVRVLAGVDVDEGSDLGGGEADVLVADDDLQLLAPHAVRLGPQGVVLGHDLAVLDDPAMMKHEDHVMIFLAM